MKTTKEKAQTCIERWRRRGYYGQVEIFSIIMAREEMLREELLSAMRVLASAGKEAEVERIQMILNDIIE
jgi:hypothetical protein